MAKYEAALVFNPHLEEEALIAGLERVKEMITGAGGEIENIDNWGKRKLAYEIKKLHEGFYYFIKFIAPESAPAAMEAKLRIREDLLRYLVTRRDDADVAVKTVAKPAPEAAPAPVAGIEAEAAPTAEEAPADSAAVAEPETAESKATEPETAEPEALPEAAQEVL